MRIAIYKPTSKILEMQSDATEGTLVRNAINAGYAEAEIEEKLVTPEEYAAALAADPDVIAEQERRALAAAALAQKELDAKAAIVKIEKITQDVEKSDSVGKLKEAVLDLIAQIKILTA